jgi:coenzyme F420-reducing hydrogenase delta subunit
MCTGRIDPASVADAFVHGAHGVLVIGCHFGDCHYISGNHTAKDKLDMTVQVLAYAGLNAHRLQFHNLSSAEGAKFAQYCGDFVEEIRHMGPLGAGDPLDMPMLQQKLCIAFRALDAPKLRWVIGKKPVFLKEGNKYGEVFTEHEMNRAVSGIIMDEMATHGILAALEKDSASVKDLSQALDIPTPETLKYILALKRRGLVKIQKISGHSPVYGCKVEARGCPNGRQ